MLKYHALNNRSIGELPRLLMEYGGIKFEYVEVSDQDVGENNNQYPFNQLPALEINGQLTSQINAIASFAGKMGQLYAEDPLEILQADAILFQSIQIYQQVTTVF